ncbi:MAG: PDZ domain-containing protein [Planctomycetota bacterium]
MKRLFILALVAGLSSVSLQAEAQEIGRGRLLRQIFGGGQQEEEQQRQQQQQQRQQQQRQQQQRTPTPANQQQLRTPTPANQNQRGQYNPSQYRQQQQRSNSFVPPQQQQRQNPQGRSPYAGQQSAPSTLPESSGPIGFGTDFGFEVEDRDDKVIVTRIRRGANADEAGLKNGDVILSVGGVEVGSAREFDEITSDMRQGDQMEFEFSRRGKEDKVLVQWGTTPDPEEYEDESAPSDSARNQAGMRSVLNSGNEASMRYSPQPSQTSEVRQLRQTIRDQQQTIDRLEREISQLRVSQSNFSSQRRGQEVRPPSTYQTPSSAPPVTGPQIQGPRR